VIGNSSHSFQKLRHFFQDAFSFLGIFTISYFSILI
jgi:hypothetical protein